MRQTSQVSRFWREVHAILAYSRIPAAFMKVDDFQGFSGFSSRIHLNFAHYRQLLTFWFVFSFQVMFCSTSLTESSTISRTTSLQTASNTKHNLLFLGGEGCLGQVCAVGLSEPLPHYSLFCGQLHKPPLIHVWANGVIVISRTEFNASRLLNIKTTAGTIFSRESSYSQPNCENATPFSGTSPTAFY